MLTDFGYFMRVIYQINDAMLTRTIVSTCWPRSSGSMSLETLTNVVQASCRTYQNLMQKSFIILKQSQIRSEMSK